MDTTEQVDALKRTSIDVDRQLKAIGRVLDLTNGNLTLAGTVTAAAFVGSGAISGASLTVTGAISCGSLVCSTGSVDIYVGSAASEDHALRFKNAAGTTVAMLEGYDANLAQGFILETKYMDGRDHWAEVIANAASTYVADVGLYAKSGSSTASLVLQCDSDGTVIATADLTARLTVSVSDAVTNTVLPALRLYRSVSGGVGADGVGVELDFYTEDSAGTYEKIANIDAVNSTALHASQVSELRFTVLGTLVLTLSSANVISSSGRLVLSDTASSQTLLIGGTAFVVDGKNKLVAIGTATTTTGVQLDIQSTDVVLRLTNTGSGGAYLGLRNGGSNSGHYWTFELGGDQVLWKRDGADIFVMTSSTWYFKVPLVYNNVASAAMHFGCTGSGSTLDILAGNVEALQLSSAGAVTVPVGLTVNGSGNVLVVDTNVLVVDATNDLVGIGATPAVNKLWVVADGVSYNGISAGNSATLGSSSGAYITSFALGIPSAADQRLGVFGSGAYYTGTSTSQATAIESYSSEAWGASTAGGYLVFKTCAGGGTRTRSERMRITAAGVGIGTTAPERALHLSGDASTAGSAYMDVANSTGNWDGPYFVGRRARGTIASKSDLSDGDVLLAVLGQGWRGGTVNDWKTGARMTIRSGGTWSDTSTPGHIYFYTTRSGSTAASLSVIIASDGGLRVYHPTSTSSYMNMTLDSNQALWDIYGSTYQNYNFRATQTITGTTADGTAAQLGMAPQLTASSPQTVTRYNYLNLSQPTLTNVTITDGCAMRFNAAIGTHVCIDNGTTKSSPGTVTAWMKVNINSTVYYIPVYSSKTS